MVRWLLHAVTNDHTAGNLHDAQSGRPPRQAPAQGSRESSECQGARVSCREFVSAKVCERNTNKSYATTR